MRIFLLTLFFFCSFSFAQELVDTPEAGHINLEQELSKEQSLDLVNLVLRAQSLAQRIETLQAQALAIQAQLQVIERQRAEADQAFDDTFNAICGGLKLDPEKYQLDMQSGKLIPKQKEDK
ncbi:MAG: hypothetical protein ACRD1R_10785 [Acidobacteriota bacterium]